MVNLLYFQQLVFMSFPLFPFGSIVALAMAIANFKFKKFILMTFMQKPTTPWAAKDAASFFVKFYFFTFSISAVVTVFMINNTTFPKACALMQSVVDELYPLRDPLVGGRLSVHVCVRAPLLTPAPQSECPNDQCLLDERSLEDVLSFKDFGVGLEELRFWETYLYQGQSGPVPIYSTLRSRTGYSSPAAVRDSNLLVCTLACGPFVFNTKAYQPIDRSVPTLPLHHRSPHLTPPPPTQTTDEEHAHRV